MSNYLPKLEAQITVPTGGYAMTVTDSGGTATVTVLTAGTYYPNSSTALLSTIASALTANTTLAGTYSCTSDDGTATSTGQTTLSATGGGNFSVTWTSTTLRGLLGFTADLSGAATYTSTNACKYIFLPDVPRAPGPTPDGSTGVPVTDASVTVSPTGTSKILVWNTRYVNKLAFRMLSGRKTWTQYETYTNESLQSFYLNVIGLGIPYRYHYDRATDGTYVDERVTSPGLFDVKSEFAQWVGGVGTDGTVSRWAFGPVDVIKYL